MVEYLLSAHYKTIQQAHTSILSWTNENRIQSKMSWRQKRLSLLGSVETDSKQFYKNIIPCDCYRLMLTILLIALPVAGDSCGCCCCVRNEISTFISSSYYYCYNKGIVIRTTANYRTIRWQNRRNNVKLVHIVCKLCCASAGMKMQRDWSFWKERIRSRNNLIGSI